MSNYRKKFTKISRYLFIFVLASIVLSLGFKKDIFAANAKVTNLKQVDASTNYVKIKWDLPLGVEKVSVYISENRNFPENATIIKDTYYGDYTIYNLNPNHTYFVKVIPVSTPNMTFDFSDTIACTTSPECIDSLKYTNATASSISVAWNAPISGAQYYNIYYEPSNSAMQPMYAGSTAKTTFTVSKLIDDTNYNIYVYPVKKSENGFEAVGSRKYITYKPTLAKANKFSQFKLQYFSASSTNATISFQNDTKHQSGIEIEISSLSGKKINSIKTGYGYSSRVSFSLSKIKNKGFKYRLRSYVTTDNKECYGPYTKSKIVVASPKVTAYKKSNSSLNLRWEKISGAKSYTVYMAKERNDRFKKVATVKSNNYTLKKTKPYKNYYIYVKANGVKSGKKSYSSTTAVYHPITQIYYSKYGKNVSNYYTNSSN